MPVRADAVRPDEQYASHFSGAFSVTGAATCTALGMETMTTRS